MRPAPVFGNMTSWLPVVPAANLRAKRTTQGRTCGWGRAGSGQQAAQSRHGRIIMQHLLVNIVAASGTPCPSCWPPLFTVYHVASESSYTSSGRSLYFPPLGRVLLSLFPPNAPRSARARFPFSLCACEG